MDAKGVGAGGDAAGRPVRQDFTLSEYAALQAKIDRAVTDLQRVETVVPLAIAAVYVWLWKDSVQAGAAARWLHLLPPVMAMFGLHRQEVRYAYISKVETYLRRVEAATYGQCDLHNSVCGWERYYGSVVHYGHRNARRIFWFVLILATSLLAVYQIWFR